MNRTLAACRLLFGGPGSDAAAHALDVLVFKNFTGLIDVQQGVLANQTTADWSTSAGHMSLNVASGAYFDLRTDNTVIETNTGTQLIVRDTFNTSTSLRRFIRLRVSSQP